MAWWGGHVQSSRSGRHRPRMRLQIASALYDRHHVLGDRRENQAMPSPLGPHAMEPLVYLSLRLLQQALLEPDLAKSEKLARDADEIRDLAEISKRLRAGQ